MPTTVTLAKWVMKKYPSMPVFDRKKVGERREVFNHPVFLHGNVDERRTIMLKSSESKYADEFEFSFDNYFSFPLQPHLEGKEVLDLGCFTGGRTAAWFERYKLKHVSGMDIDPIYIEAANQFAQSKGISADYKVGFGEYIPYPDNAFDAVLTFDVLEHVVDVRKTLDECYRVLKPGGKIYLVFPTYYQPMEHHLGMVSKAPGLQMMFSGKTLVRAYFEIIEERMPDSKWYKRDSPELDAHEAGHTINGTSYRAFRNLVSPDRWATEFVCRKPIGSIGRSLKKGGSVGILSSLFAPLTYVPYLQEIFLHRVTMVLKKK